MVNPVLRVQIIDKEDKVIAESWDCSVASRAWELIDDSLTRKPKATVSDAYINNLDEELRKANAVLQDECSDLREENIEMQDDIRQLSAECDHWKGLAGVYKKLASVDEKALQESINADKKVCLDPCRNYGPTRYKYGPEHRCKNCEYFVVGNSSRMSLCTLKDTFAIPTNPDDTCGHWIPKKRNTYSESDGK